MSAINPNQQRRRGTAAVETAVIMIFLAPLLVGTWEVGRLVQVQQLMVNAAREGARNAAAGNSNAATVKQVVANYLTLNGITCSTSDVTVTNLTNSARADPSAANQLDQFQVTVTIPFSSVRWVTLKQITPASQLTASATWLSMNDTALTVNTNVPLQ